jgi:hypothetical protein
MESPGGDAVKPRAAHPPSAHAWPNLPPGIQLGIIEVDCRRTAMANSTVTDFTR